VFLCRGCAKTESERKRVRRVQDHLAPPLIDEAADIEDLPPTSKPPPPRPPAQFAFPVAFGQADGHSSFLRPCVSLAPLRSSSLDQRRRREIINAAPRRSPASDMGEAGALPLPVATLQPLLVPGLPLRPPELPEPEPPLPEPLPVAPLVTEPVPPPVPKLLPPVPPLVDEPLPLPLPPPLPVAPPLVDEPLPVPVLPPTPLPPPLPPQGVLQLLPTQVLRSSRSVLVAHDGAGLATRQLEQVVSATQAWAWLQHEASRQVSQAATPVLTPQSVAPLLLLLDELVLVVPLVLDDELLVDVEPPPQVIG
jgi:hypothetical protein